MSVRPPTPLPADLDTCHQMIAHLLSDMQSKDREILNLKCQLEALRRRLFGRKSEQIDPNQLALFEDLTRRLEEAQASRSEPAHAEDPKPQSNRNGHTRRPLPPDLGSSRQRGWRRMWLRRCATSLA